MKKLSIAILLAGYLVPLSADQVIADDLIVQGSICTGFDCVNGENFGSDTLMLKENNLRIYFNDTSNSGSFPSNDWRITANDQTNGGANRFSIDDATAGRTIFNIEAGAPTNSLYVDNTGHIGFGTSTPVVDLHTRSGNTPALRLEQDGSSGFASQTWDIAANETNFFIRDITNGSRIPFKIVPGAPTNSMYINSSGKVGLGTVSPDANLHVIGNVMISQTDTGAGDAPLHVQRSDGTAKIHIEETGTTGNRFLLSMTNTGNTYMQMNNTNASNSWALGTWNDDFVLTQYGVADRDLVLRAGGNLEIQGTLTELSDVNAKENIVLIDSTEVLHSLDSLPIYTWNYKRSDVNDKHIGAMAQDFYDTFGYGSSDKSLSPRDVAFVAVASVKALKQQIAEQNAEIASLRKELSDLQQLQARIIHLEGMVQQVTQSKNPYITAQNISTLK